MFSIDVLVFKFRYHKYNVEELVKGDVFDEVAVGIALLSEEDGDTVSVDSIGV